MYNMESQRRLSAQECVTWDKSPKLITGSHFLLLTQESSDDLGSLYDSVTILVYFWVALQIILQHEPCSPGVGIRGGCYSNL